MIIRSLFLDRFTPERVLTLLDVLDEAREVIRRNWIYPGIREPFDRYDALDKL